MRRVWTAAQKSNAMPKGKKVAATLDGLGGEAASRVHFVRTDARAAVPTSASKTQLKDAFASELEPQRVVANSAAEVSILRQVFNDFSSAEAASVAKVTKSGAEDAKPQSR